MISRITNSEVNKVNSKSLVILVVPCFNEEYRWVLDYWRSISKIQDLKLYFVNDGSRTVT